MVNIAIFASGGGSNASAICAYFENHTKIKVSTIITNKANAGVIEVARKFNIPCHVIGKKDLQDESLITCLENHGTDFIILAGFLLLLPSTFVRKFENRILNIHPSLLPAYGGEGMYGHFVHEAVHKNKEKISGMTVHLVNEKYDDGRIIFQAECPLDVNDKPAQIAEKVLKLEHTYYSQTIENYINSFNSKGKTN